LSPTLFSHIFQDTRWWTQMVYPGSHIMVQGIPTYSTHLEVLSNSGHLYRTQLPCWRGTCTCRSKWSGNHLKSRRSQEVQGILKHLGARRSGRDKRTYCECSNHHQTLRCNNLPRFDCQLLRMEQKYRLYSMNQGTSSTCHLCRLRQLLVWPLWCKNHIVRCLFQISCTRYQNLQGTFSLPQTRINKGPHSTIGIHRIRPRTPSHNNSSYH